MAQEEDDTCRTCRGAKEIRVTVDDDPNETVHEYVVKPCPGCNGSGKRS